jgi:hypothetical protein
MARHHSSAAILVAAAVALGGRAASAQLYGALDWCGNRVAAARDDRVITVDTASGGVWRGITHSPEDGTQREVALSRECARVAVADLRRVTLFGPAPSAARLELALPQTTPFVVMGDRFELRQRAVAFAPDGSRVVVELSNDTYGRPVGTTELVAFDTGSGAATRFAHAGPRDRVPFAFEWLDSSDLAVVAAVPGSDLHALRVSATSAVELSTTGFSSGALSRGPVMVFAAVVAPDGTQRLLRIDPRTGTSNDIVGGPPYNRLIGVTRDGATILTARFGFLDPKTHTVPPAWLEARAVAGGVSRRLGIDVQSETVHAYSCDARAVTCVAYSRTTSGTPAVIDPTGAGRTVYAPAPGEQVFEWRVSDDGAWLALIVDVPTTRPPRHCPPGFRGNRARVDLVVMALAGSAPVRREAISEHDACIDTGPQSVD